MTTYRDTLDWEMFWTIESKDIVKLQELCRRIAAANKDIGMYFNMASWRDVFSPEEAQRIQVFLCGMTDFSPVQHAADIGWYEGVACLYVMQIGVKTQGAGLRMINEAKFAKWWTSRVPQKPKQVETTTVESRGHAKWRLVAFAVCVLLVIFIGTASVAAV